MRCAPVPDGDVRARSSAMILLAFLTSFCFTASAHLQLEERKLRILLLSLTSDPALYA
jgi:hypothetical protein